MEIIKKYSYRNKAQKNLNPITNSNCSLQERFQIRLVSFLAVFILLISGSTVGAHTSEGISFSWAPNPDDDYVIGYRLYYSSESRFDSNGKPKTDFSYDYYIDLAESERCVSDGDGTDCEILELADLQCNDLYGDSPNCSINNLQEGLHLAMTAYNAEAESDYTQELYYAVTPNPTPNPTPNTLAAVQMIQALLLLKQ